MLTHIFKHLESSAWQSGGGIADRSRAEHGSAVRTGRRSVPKKHVPATWFRRTEAAIRNTLRTRGTSAAKRQHARPEEHDGASA